MRVVSAAYLRLLIFLPAILTPAFCLNPNFLSKPGLLILFPRTLIFSYRVFSLQYPWWIQATYTSFLLLLKQPVTHFPTSSLVTFYFFFLLVLHQITSSPWLKNNKKVLPYRSGGQRSEKSLSGWKSRHNWKYICFEDLADNPFPCLL